MLTVLPGFVPQIVKHLLGAKVFASNFLGIHKALADGKKLMLAHFNHLTELALFLVEAGILLLFLTQL